MVGGGVPWPFTGKGGKGLGRGPLREVPLRHSGPPPPVPGRGGKGGFNQQVRNNYLLRTPPVAPPQPHIEEPPLRLVGPKIGDPPPARILGPHRLSPWIRLADGSK